MKITVIRDDGTVIKDGTAILGLDMSSIATNIHAIQWDGAVGEIEFKPNADGEVKTEVISDMGIVSQALALWEEKHAELNAPPTEAVLLAECKGRAKYFLEQSDWAVLPDVNISNKADFESYRTALRGLYLNPQVSPTFPTEPTPIWV